MSALKEYGYRAVDSAGHEAIGRIEAGRAEDALFTLREHDLYPICISDGPVPQASHGQGCAEQVVDLLLLQALREGATEILFACTEREVSVRYRVEGAWHRMLPPPEPLSAAVLECLRRLGRQQDLGSANASSRAQIEVGWTFPHLSPRPVTCAFESHAATPGCVIMRPQWHGRPR